MVKSNGTGTHARNEFAMKISLSTRNYTSVALSAVALASCFPLHGVTLSGNFSALPASSNVNLTVNGKLDWVHWGLGGDYKVNRKASVTPLISNFTLISVNNTNDPLAFSSAYWLEDTNANRCSWSDGNPTVATNTDTRVLAYAYPVLGGSGFKLTVPADNKT